MTTDNRSFKFLDLIRRSERGRLKVYLGYGPGVGKTYQMLQEAHRLKADGIDVVVGYIETHGRRETEAQAQGLDTLPRRQIVYRGITVEEFDVDACLARRPRVAVVDELPHTNVPGSRHAKRYEDVQELLAAGIHVITAMNVQHLESLYNTVEQLVKVKVRERVPDAVLAEADQVVNIDVAPEDLQRRLRDGKIYPPQRVASSLENFFQSENLEHLRELSFRELAGHIDTRRRERGEADTQATVGSDGGDQIMVCLSSRGPSSARLLRFGSRLAGRLNRNWYAVYVQTPGEDPLRIDAATQRLLSDTLTLANQLGATVFTFKGDDVPETILRFAREYRVGQIVIGRPNPIRWWQRLLGERSVAERLIVLARRATVVVVDADAEDPPPPATPAIAPASPLTALTSDEIAIYQQPVAYDQLVRDLVGRIAAKHPEVDVEQTVAKISEREALGSTALNADVSLPHCRLASIHQAYAAIGLTRSGVVDGGEVRVVQIVFLLLTPELEAAIHLRALAAVSRQLQRFDTHQVLTTTNSTADVLSALREK